MTSVKLLVYGLRSAVLVLLSVGPTVSWAASGLEAELSKAARKIAQHIRGEGEDSVAVGQFIHPTLSDVTGGAGIAKIISDGLAREGIAVKRRAKLGLTGKLLNVRNEQGRVSARITGELVDGSGEVLFAFNCTVAGVDAVASLLGVTAELPPQQAGKERDKRLEEQIEQPHATVQRNRVSAGMKSPYAIEIWVKTGPRYEPRPLHLEEGQAFVRLDRDDIYAVNVINDSPYDAAVQLSIDGLPMFSFSENASYRHVIVPAGSQGFIKGWHRTNSVSDSFLVTEYAKSAAAELLPDSPTIGTVVAIFSAAWPGDQPPPPDEPKLASTRGQATARGPEVRQEYREVAREVGVPRAVVSVRYAKH